MIFCSWKSDSELPASAWTLGQLSISKQAIYYIQYICLAASRLEAIAIGWEAIASRLEAIATRLEAIY